MKLLISDEVGNDIWDNFDVYIYNISTNNVGNLVRADIIDKLWNTVERTLLFI